MSLIIVCIVFYLIGSFPTAYLLVKYKYNKSILREGSGNAGARNTFDVTHSKLDGAVVLITDLLKGLLPVLWFINYSGIDDSYVVFPSLFLLIGHNYSVWLKFKGGRGLSTAAGIMLAVNFTLVILWLFFCFIFYKLAKNIHIASAVALLLLPVSIIFLQDIILKFNNPELKNIDDPFRFLFSFCSSVCIVILLRHVSPVIQFLSKKIDS